MQIGMKRQCKYLWQEERTLPGYLCALRALPVARLVKRITAACSLREFQTRYSASSAAVQSPLLPISFQSTVFLVTPNDVDLTAANSQVSEHIFELIITSIVSVLNNFLFQVNSAVLLAALKGIWGGYQECKHGSVAKLHCCSIHSRLSACVNSISSDLCSFVLLVDMQLLLKDVAYMSKDGLQFEYLENESSATLWPDGVPPLLRVQNHPLLPLWIICNTYAAVLIVFAVVCIVFNIVNRKKK